MPANHQNSLTPDLSGLGSRIAKIADLVGGKKNLAHTIGISESQLYRYISGDSQPTVEPLAAIAKCGEVHLDWLVLGDGPTGLLNEIHDVKGIYSSPQQLITIAEYVDPDQTSHSGRQVSTIGKPAFNYHWLLKAGLNPDNLRLTCADDDSMSPTFNPGDLLLLDITQDFYTGDGVYLLKFNDQTLTARRLQYSVDNGLFLINDNPAYENQKLSSEEKDSLKIVGRIVWTAGLL